MYFIYISLYTYIIHPHIHPYIYISIHGKIGKCLHYVVQHIWFTQPTGYHTHTCLPFQAYSRAFGQPDTPLYSTQDSEVPFYAPWNILEWFADASPTGVNPHYRLDLIYCTCCQCRVIAFKVARGVPAHDSAGESWDETVLQGMLDAHII